MSEEVETIRIHDAKWIPKERIEYHKPTRNLYRDGVLLPDGVDQENRGIVIIKLGEEELE